MKDDGRKEQSEQRTYSVEEGLEEHARIVAGLTGPEDRVFHHRGLTHLDQAVAEVEEWKGVAVGDLEELQAKVDRLQHDMGATVAAVEMALAMSLHPFGLRLERLGPLVDDPTTPTQTLALLKHLCWCCYQMGAGQEWNWPPTEDNINSQRDAVKFQVATLAKKGSLNPQDNHDNWMKFRLEEGWVYGPVKDVEAKTHPDLVPYDELPEVERAKDDMDILAFNAGLEILLRRGGPTDIRWHYPAMGMTKLPPNPVDLEGLGVTPQSVERDAGYICPKCGSGTTIMSGVEQTHNEVPFYIDGHIICKNKACRHTIDIRLHVQGILFLNPLKEVQFPCLPCGGDYLTDTKHNAGLCGHKAAPANAFCEELLRDDGPPHCPVDEEKKPARWDDIPCKGEHAVEHPIPIGHYDWCNHPGNDNNKACQVLLETDDCPVEDAQVATTIDRVILFKHDHADDEPRAGCPACDNEDREDYEADKASDEAPAVQDAMEEDCP